MGLVIIIFSVFLAASYVNRFVLLRNLKLSHRDLWIELGEPSLTQSNLRKPYWRFMKFIWCFQFLEVHDKKLSAICFTAILLESGVLVSAVWFMVGK